MNIYRCKNFLQNVFFTHVDIYPPLKGIGEASEDILRLIEECRLESTRFILSVDHFTNMPQSPSNINICQWLNDQIEIVKDLQNMEIIIGTKSYVYDSLTQKFDFEPDLHTFLIQYLITEQVLKNSTEESLESVLSNSNLEFKHIRSLFGCNSNDLKIYKFDPSDEENTYSFDSLKRSQITSISEIFEEKNLIAIDGESKLFILSDFCNSRLPSDISNETVVGQITQNNCYIISSDKIKSENGLFLSSSKFDRI